MQNEFETTLVHSKTRTLSDTDECILREPGWAWSINLLYGFRENFLARYSWSGYMKSGSQYQRTILSIFNVWHKVSFITACQTKTILNAQLPRAVPRQIGLRMRVYSGTLSARFSAWLIKILSTFQLSVKPHPNPLKLTPLALTCEQASSLFRGGKKKTPEHRLRSPLFFPSLLILNQGGCCSQIWRTLILQSLSTVNLSHLAGFQSNPVIFGRNPEMTRNCFS